MNGDEIAASGQTIGRYHLHREIAKGGMARIHIARVIGSGGFTRLVAAKRLDPRFANDEEFVQMFLDEARVASKIHHRNVVPVLDVVSHDGEVIMVQELVHGVPLNKLFARAHEAQVRFPVDIAVSIAAQILLGLHAAHEAVDETGASLAIVHRDVSPQNVMIAVDGTARLLDFGVAKAAATARLHVTRAGTFKGKVTYSSPEHLLAMATRQSDVYSLAIVLWELLAGERMHVGRPDREVYRAILEGTPRAITDVHAAERAAGKIDDATWTQLCAIEPVLQCAFARDLSVRYATAADMEKALLAAVTPASLTELAAWMRALAKDLLAQAEQVIAAEEASWRRTRATRGRPVLANGSGCMGSAADPTLVAPLPMEPRSSTSIETETLRPNAHVRRWRGAQRAATSRLLALPLAIAAAPVVLVALALLVATASHVDAPGMTPPRPSIVSDEPAGWHVVEVARIAKPRPVVRRSKHLRKPARRR